MHQASKSERRKEQTAAARQPFFFPLLDLILALVGPRRLVVRCLYPCPITRGRRPGQSRAGAPFSAFGRVFSLLLLFLGDRASPPPPPPPTLTTHHSDLPSDVHTLTVQRATNHCQLTNQLTSAALFFSPSSPASAASHTRLSLSFPPSLFLPPALPRPPAKPLCW